VYRTNHAHLTGRVEDCETLADHAFAHRFQGHDEAAAHIFGVQMLFVRREQGRLDELVHTVGGVTERYPQLVAWRCAVAHVYAELDCRTQARQELEALADADFEDLPRNQFWLTNMSWLSEVVAFLADGPRAQRLYELLLPYADRCVVIFALLCRGSASRSLGLLAMTLSRFDDAERHFQHALMMNAQIRSPLWIAHTQHDYARMLLARNKPGDHDTALDLLEQALATAAQLGLTALAEKAGRLKLATQATVSPQGLTSRYPAVAPM
jgi:tetratricopeptide (TPR) repeat protein